MTGVQTCALPIFELWVAEETAAVSVGDGPSDMIGALAEGNAMLVVGSVPGAIADFVGTSVAIPVSTTCLATTRAPSTNAG